MNSAPPFKVLVQLRSSIARFFGIHGRRGRQPRSWGPGVHAVEGIEQKGEARGLTAWSWDDPRIGQAIEQEAALACAAAAVRTLAAGAAIAGVDAVLRPGRAIHLRLDPHQR